MARRGGKVTDGCGVGGRVVGRGEGVRGCASATAGVDCWGCEMVIWESR